MIKEFKNGNISVKFDKDTMTDIASGKIDAVEALLWELEWKDTYVIGEGYCLSNYDTGFTVYNCRLDKVYIVSGTALDRAVAGYTLKLYALDPDETDRETIAREGA